MSLILFKENKIRILNDDIHLKFNWYYYQEWNKKNQISKFAEPTRGYDGNRYVSLTKAVQILQKFTSKKRELYIREIKKFWTFKFRW